MKVGSVIFNKVSKVIVPMRANLAFTPNYSKLPKFDLAFKYNTVTETNRFASLEILLSRLSGYVGRRQYKMNHNLKEKFEEFKAQGVDWQQMKAMPTEDFVELCEDVGVSHAQFVPLQVAMHCKLCGVLTRAYGDRDPQLICFREGRVEHGWRCGVGGHTRDIYFEEKPPATGSIVLHKRPDAVTVEENGIQVELRPEPNFSIEGRLHHDSGPRIFSSPKDPQFDVTVIGYEFRVHPQDPRAAPQIAMAASDWDLHAQVIRSVLWEMLELYGVKGDGVQPTEIQPGEMAPDNCDEHSAAFTDVDPETGTVIERRMKLASSAEGKKEIPWFLPPLPQPFTDGVPDHLPFAPTVIIRATFRPVRSSSSSSSRKEQLLCRPLMDIAMLVHPKACFYLSKEDEDKCLKHVLDHAKKLPFALPFNLYFRVDPASLLMENEAFSAERNRRLEEKRKKYFNLGEFGDVGGFSTVTTETSGEPAAEAERGSGYREEAANSSPVSEEDGGGGDDDEEAGPNPFHWY